MDPKVIEFFKRINEFKQKSRIKECFYHDKTNCSTNIIQAHSLQRNGRLSLIEDDVNGSKLIYTSTSMIPTPESPIGDFKPVGKKEASTFYGFCGHHDTTLFSEIENQPFDGSDKHCFLHSYRSFAHSYHRKKEELIAYEGAWSVVNGLPSGFLEQHTHGIRLAINDLERDRQYLDGCIEGENWSGLEYLVDETNEMIPVGCSSAINPHFTPQGTQLDEFENEVDPWTQILLTVFPDPEKTIAILAAIPHEDGKGQKFLDDFESLPDLKFWKAISAMMIKLAENTFWAPSLWQALGQKGKLALKGDMRAAMEAVNIKGFPTSNVNFFASKFYARKLRP